MSVNAELFTQPIAVDQIAQWGIEVPEIENAGWDYLDRYCAFRPLDPEVIETASLSLARLAIIAQDGFGFGVGLSASLICEEDALQEKATDRIHDKVFERLPGALWLLVSQEADSKTIARMYNGYAYAAYNELFPAESEAPGLTRVLDLSVFPELEIDDLDADTFTVAAFAGFGIVRQAFESVNDGHAFFNRDDDVAQAGGVVTAASHLLHGAEQFLRQASSGSDQQ